jgi:sugar/nucleoside kinase (ribokinase family)
MPKSFDIIVVGDYFIDLIFSGLPGMPELGKELYSRDFTMIPGGTYNAVVAMHRLGLKVGWACDFGDDEFSRFVYERARTEGLDPSLMVRHHKSMRRVTVAVSFPHERAFISYCDPEPSIPAAIKGLALTSARALLIPGLYYGDWFQIGAKLVRTRHMRLIMDGNSTQETLQNTPQLKTVLQELDLFLPNAGEARRLTGEDDLERAMDVLSHLCRLVAVKDGVRGAYACSVHGCIHSPAILVEPVETTGAGDCFDAGFIKAWLDDLPLAECLVWGNILGGLSTRALGGTGRMIREKEVMAWVRKLSSPASNSGS